MWRADGRIRVSNRGRIQVRNARNESVWGLKRTPSAGKKGGDACVTVNGEVVAMRKLVREVFGED